MSPRTEFIDNGSMDHLTDGQNDGIVTSFSINDNDTSHHIESMNKKRVSFVPFTTQRHYLHIQDYTPDEIMASWYTPYEIKDIQAETKLLIRKVDGAPTIEGRDHVIDELLLGLEGYTYEGSKKKRLSRRNAKYALFYEQEDQKLFSVPDEHGRTFWDLDDLAEEYMMHTYESQQEAHQRGLRYEHYASENDDVDEKTTNDQDNNNVSTDSKLQRTLVRFNSLLYGQTNNKKQRKDELRSIVQSTPAA